MRRDKRFPAMAHIRVMGVGGGGSNAINRMIREGLRGVDFISVNTDVQCLAESSAPRRLRIGRHVTRGLGCGGHATLGEQAAYESIADIRAALAGSDMLFITAGMGGGTGTGAAPVIAEVAQEMGILTIAIVTQPFRFEGRQRTQLAESGIEQLKKHIDTLIVIPNDRLLVLANERTNLSDAFSLADKVLRQSIQVVSDLITSPGLINLDFADVRTVLSQQGATLMSVGAASGPDRASKAAEQVIYSPLLDQSITDARGMLINITAGNDLHLWEVEQATQILRGTVHPDAHFMFGTVLDEAMGDELRITVIASGFNDKVAGRQPQAPQLPQTAPTLAAEAFTRSLKDVPVREGTAVLAAVEEKTREGAASSRWRFSLKDYAVPAFLQPHQ